MAEREDVRQPTDLDDLLDRIESTAEGSEAVSVGDVLDEIGTRSFGPIVLLAGLIMLAPLVGDIPGVPTAMAMVVVLTAGQLLFRRDYVWFPDWLLNRSADSEKLRKGIEWLRKPARVIDRLIRPRLGFLVRDAGLVVMAAACVLVAAATPALEFIPFSANLAGAALTAFGLALIACDGLLGIIAFLFTAGVFGIVAYNVL